MAKFLIERQHGGWFDLYPDQFQASLRPATIHWKEIDGPADFQIEVEGAHISFLYDKSGVEVIFDPCTLDYPHQKQIADEIRLNIEKITHQPGIIIEKEPPPEAKNAASMLKRFLPHG